MAASSTAVNVTATTWSIITSEAEQLSSAIANIGLISVSLSQLPPSVTTISGPSATTHAAGMQQPDYDNNGECELLGSFALLVQAALGGLALLALVYKRWKERPQRPVKVWAFDVSKQVFGSVLLHLANLVMSMFSAGQTPVTATYQPNPCSYYLLNLGIDTTLGIPILILILRVLNHAALYTPLANPPESIESGNYGQPPKAGWWFKQSMIYFIGLLCMKTCVFFIIQLLPFIVKIGDWALRWTEGNEAIQIFFVMLLFPVIMNAVQYYIIDTFIKKPISAGNDPLAASHSFDAAMADDDRHHRSALLAGLDDDGEGSYDDSATRCSTDEIITKSPYDSESVQESNDATRSPP